MGFVPLDADYPGRMILLSNYVSPITIYHQTSLHMSHTKYDLEVRKLTTWFAVFM